MVCHPGGVSCSIKYVPVVLDPGRHRYRILQRCRDELSSRGDYENTQDKRVRNSLDLVSSTARHEMFLNMAGIRIRNWTHPPWTKYGSNIATTRTVILELIMWHQAAIL